jgi:hypothetical protein
MTADCGPNTRPFSDNSADLSPYERITEHLEQRTETNFICPAHDDNKASLSVSEAEDRRALVHCHAGCETEDVLEAIGLRVRDLFPDNSMAWEIRDTDGTLKAIHRRKDNPDGDKRMWWCLPDGTPSRNGKIKTKELPLYGAHTLAATPEEVPIVLVEGEKAKDALDWHGIPAVATVTGAGGTPSRKS